MLANEMCLFIDLELDEFFFAKTALLIAFNYYYFLILRLLMKEEKLFCKEKTENLLLQDELS